MITNDQENVVDPKNRDITNYDSTDKSDDTLGENAGDSAIDQSNDPNVQDKPDEARVKTVTPAEDGEPGTEDEKPITNSSAEQPVTNSSNKGQGPSGENL